MGLTFRFSKKKGRSVSQTIKIQDADSTFRQVVQSLRDKKEECVIQDEADRPVAVVLPIERYESYQAYRREREADFAVFDEVAEAFKDVNPEELQARIDQAVDEVKARHNAQRRATA